MKNYSFSLYILLLCCFVISSCAVNKSINEDIVNTPIPLPEHPRPDFERKQWINLNGTWNFEFDKDNKGEKHHWFEGKEPFTQKINVPFSWGSKLSGVKGKADIGWYQRIITIPKSWRKNHVYLVIGASNWLTTVWLNGNKVGSYKGGYIPFELDLSNDLLPVEKQQLVIKVDDTGRPFKLSGKQIWYGEVSGIWQTPYLESRPDVSLSSIHFSPNIDNNTVNVDAKLNAPSSGPITLTLNINTPGKSIVKNEVIPAGKDSVTFTVNIPKARLWQLNDPYLYNVTAHLKTTGANEDEVQTYFGMRKISVMNLPGTTIPYVALNNKPVYLKLALDQSYNRDGLYTFPSDTYMKNEILRAKAVGLNGLRIHIKIEVPRKLYWADKLGLLIMADVPNSWSQPDEPARHEKENAIKGMIKRDYNHPSIFSWVIFNETWGLNTTTSNDKSTYTKETQDWVAGMYHLAKSLDNTRLTDDNSTCNYDHVVTDLNSWHAYPTGFDWNKTLDDFSNKTFPGSTWNFINSNKQGNQPNINAECGNYYGYTNGIGDADYSWDYHIMMNDFHAHPKVAGWVYTELFDVALEWNGYYRYDRTPKVTGLNDIVPGMGINDLNSDIYLSPRLQLNEKVQPGANVTIPLWLSVMSDKYKGPGTIKTELILYDRLGNEKPVSNASFPVTINPWDVKALNPISTKMPNVPGLAILRMILQDDKGNVLQHNFTTFTVGMDKAAPRDEKVVIDDASWRILRFAPASFTKANWSLKQWDVMNGLKIDGAGAGYFEYTIDLPADIDLSKVKETTLRLEASAKELFEKDKSPEQQEADKKTGKWQFSSNKSLNSYPMTDGKLFPSKVYISVNGQNIEAIDLKDDPADQRGILSWGSQLKDYTLHEPGSYGYLISVKIPREILTNAAKEHKLTIRFSVNSSLPGGLAIYGEHFGRYPIDPMLMMRF